MNSSNFFYGFYLVFCFFFFGGGVGGTWCGEFGWIVV
uniref:Uncharacterized protein n=1 Tax=Rhizophora mucronata TaxID=61149 RepID=A0A2P2PE25_RHIMU